MEQTTDEIKSLQGCINDLISVLALPAIWGGHESPRTNERYAQLTPRERTVMAQVVAGLLNKQIAVELGISEQTVKVHR